MVHLEPLCSCFKIILHQEGKRAGYAERCKEGPLQNSMIDHMEPARKIVQGGSAESRVSSGYKHVAGSRANRVTRSLEGRRRFSFQGRLSSRAHGRCPGKLYRRRRS